MLPPLRPTTRRTGRSGGAGSKRRAAGPAVHAGRPDADDEVPLEAAIAALRRAVHALGVQGHPRRLPPPRTSCSPLSDVHLATCAHRRLLTFSRVVAGCRRHLCLSDGTGSREDATCVVRGAWLGTVLLAGAAAACASAGPKGFDDATEAGGAPHYDGATPENTPDAAQAGDAGADAPAEATLVDTADGGADATHPGAGGGLPRSPRRARRRPRTTGGTKPEAGVDAKEEGAVWRASTAPEASTRTPRRDPSPDPSRRRRQAPATDARSPDRRPRPGRKGRARSDVHEAGVDATPAEAGIVAPVYDGVIGAGEYGGASNQGTRRSRDRPGT